jgi:hypothetical protein
MRSAYEIFDQKPLKGRDLLNDLGLDWMIIIMFGGCGLD